MDPETLDTVVGIVTIVAVLIAAAGLLFNVREARKQTNTQLFLDYTSRYDRVMEAFPTDAFGYRLDTNAIPPATSPELSHAVLRYLNLSSEEFYLHSKGYLDDDIWSIWQRELDRTLQSPLVRREWLVLKREFESYPEFQAYVEAKQKV